MAALGQLVGHFVSVVALVAGYVLPLNLPLAVRFEKLRHALPEVAILSKCHHTCMYRRRGTPSLAACRHRASPFVASP